MCISQLWKNSQFYLWYGQLIMIWFTKFLCWFLLIIYLHIMQFAFPVLAVTLAHNFNVVGPHHLNDAYLNLLYKIMNEWMKKEKLQLCAWEYAGIISQQIVDDSVISGNETLYQPLTCNWSAKIYLIMCRQIEQILELFLKTKGAGFRCVEVGFCMSHHRSF